MKIHLGLLLIWLCLVSSCAHNDSTPMGDRAPSSTSSNEDSIYQAQWENDICVVKGESREQDYVVRFSDVHYMCPKLRDYNPAGVAYSKWKDKGRGVHIPACRSVSNAHTQAAKCWMGFDVFGQSIGSCSLSKMQTPCTSCQCNGKNGVAWPQ
jgi:hypothetical protein